MADEIEYDDFFQGAPCDACGTKTMRVTKKPLPSGKNTRCTTCGAEGMSYIVTDKPPWVNLEGEG